MDQLKSQQMLKTLLTNLETAPNVSSCLFCSNIVTNIAVGNEISTLNSYRCYLKR